MTSRPVIISVAMHVLLALLALVGLPSISRDMPDEMPIVIMEIVDTVPENNLIEGDKVSTAEKAQDAAKTSSRKTPPPPPPPRRAPEPEPTKAETIEPPKPDLSAEVLPEKPQVKPKLAEAKSPALPKQLPKPKPKRPNKPKKQVQTTQPAPKPKPNQKSKAKQQQEELARKVNKLAKEQEKRKQAGEAALQNLTKMQAEAEDAQKKKKAQQRKEASDILTKTLTQTAGNAIKAQKEKKIAPVGADDITRILNHISTCWQPPLGAAGNDSLIVDIIVSLDRDGNVLNAEVADKLRFNLDRYFKVAASEAQRATIACSPLPIPADKYDQMKELTIGFNPKFLSR